MCEKMHLLGIVVNAYYTFLKESNAIFVVLELYYFVLTQIVMYYKL